MELRLEVDGVAYVWEHDDDSPMGKELKRVAKLLNATRLRLDAKLDELRKSQTT